MARHGADGYLSWFGVIRLGLVQTALGAVIVITTSTLNRVMQVELGFLALLPAALVAFHYLVQVTRPHWGWASDRGGRRAPWILGGMGVLATGGVLASLATALMATAPGLGLALAVFAFLLIGLGVGAAGTTLLALLAARVAPARRPAAASVVWIMMIVGFVLTAGIGGAFLEPFTFSRLILVTAIVCGFAMLVSTLCVWGVEGNSDSRVATPPHRDKPSVAFLPALKDVFADRDASRFTIFVFVAMLAYNAQDIVLEPFGGAVFGMSVGETTQLSGMHHGGVLLGLIAVAILGRRFGSLGVWTAGGCLASALAFLGLAVGAFFAPAWPLEANVFSLGLSNGAFAGAAIASMFALAGAAGDEKSGVRMGVWGAAQAFGFGVAGLIGALVKDAVAALQGSDMIAYVTVFGLESGLFIAAAAIALAIRSGLNTHIAPSTPISADFDAAELAAR